MVARFKQVMAASGLALALVATAPTAAQVSSASPPLTTQQLLQLNTQSKALEKELLDRDIELAWLNGRLDAIRRGEVFIRAVAPYASFTEAEARAFLLKIRSERRSTSDPFAMFDIDVEAQLAEARAYTRTLEAQILQSRNDTLRRRNEIRERLIQIRRTIIADADRPGSAYDPRAGGGPPAGACAFPHAWRNEVTGLSSSTWQVDASGAAHESGMGAARGRASLSGQTLRIDFQTGPTRGYYQVTLDADCNGRGRLQWTASPAGPKSFPATFTSLSGR